MMNLKQSAPFASRFLHHRGIGYLLLGAFCICSASAAPRSSRKKTAHVKLPPPEMHRDSSRFLDETQRKAFLDQILAKLAMNGRETDPFYLPQNPDAKPPAPKVIATNNVEQVKPAEIPFSEIVNKLKITTIIPKEKRFLINSRSYQIGDTLSLRFQGKVVEAIIESVDANAIILRDKTSNEAATISENRLPSGMQTGITKLDSDNIFQGDADSPIQLDASQQDSSD